jgi:hypothetical protein
MLIYAILLDFQPSQLGFWTSLAVWTSPALILGTNLAAMLFPKTNPTIFNSSPVAKYKWVVIAFGAIMVIISGFLLVGYAVIPTLEVGIGPPGFIFAGVLAIASVLWYFGFRNYQLKKGIDVSLTYKMLPPE